jgi:hypothetical protein
MRASIKVAWSLSSAVAMLVAVAGGAVGGVGQSRAASSSADLAASGMVAGGERTVESSHPVVFVFTLRNKGPATVDSSADIEYTSIKNGTFVDQLCILSNGNSFNADQPGCEYGELRPGEWARMTLIVQPTRNVSGPLSVRVCASNESGIPDGVRGNNCTTKTVML